MRQSRAPTASQIQVRRNAGETPVRHLYSNLDIILTLFSSEPSSSSLDHQVWPPVRQEPLWSVAAIPHYKHVNSLLTGTTGHALRRNAAGAFGPDLSKKLTQLVKMEKNVMRSQEQVAKERMEVAVCIHCPFCAANRRLTHGI